MYIIYNRATAVIFLHYLVFVGTRNTEIWNDGAVEVDREGGWLNVKQSQVAFTHLLYNL